MNKLQLKQLIREVIDEVRTRDGAYNKQFQPGKIVNFLVNPQTEWDDGDSPEAIWKKGKIVTNYGHGYDFDIQQLDNKKMHYSVLSHFIRPSK